LDLDLGIQIRIHSHYFQSNLQSRIASGSENICISRFGEFLDGSGSEDPDPGSRLIQAALKKFYHGIDKIKQIGATFGVNLDF
jgi:hypothetical protein